MFLESFTASAERALKRADLLAKRQNASSVEPLIFWRRWPPSQRAAPVSCSSSWASRWTVSGPGLAREFQRPWLNSDRAELEDAAPGGCATGRDRCLSRRPYGRF